MSTTLSLQIRKSQLGDTRLDDSTDTPLADGQVRVRIDSFALTSNNITYAAFGEAMSYWRFFPTGDEAWGNIPVWGFASVVQSLHPGVAVGERLYGYWPMATSAVLSPTRLSPERFADGAAHRAELPVVYNQYFRCNADPLYTADSEGHAGAAAPAVHHLLADRRLHGRQRLLRRAHHAAVERLSKTAYGTAFQLHQREGIEVVGLTSAGNVGYCESLGCYHRVLRYDALDELPADTPCVYIDFAGNGAARSDPCALHRPALQLRDRRHACRRTGLEGRHPRTRGPARHAVLRARADQEAHRRMERRGIQPPHGGGLAGLHRARDRRRQPLAARRAPPRRRGRAGGLCPGAGRQGRSAHRPHPVAARAPGGL